MFSLKEDHHTFAKSGGSSALLLRVNKICLSYQLPFILMLTVTDFKNLTKVKKKKNPLSQTLDRKKRNGIFLYS